MIHFVIYGDFLGSTMSGISSGKVWRLGWLEDWRMEWPGIFFLHLSGPKMTWKPKVPSGVASSQYVDLGVGRLLTWWLRAQAQVLQTPGQKLHRLLWRSFIVTQTTSLGWGVTSHPESKGRRTVPTIWWEEGQRTGGYETSRDRELDKVSDLELEPGSFESKPPVILSLIQTAN